MTNGNSNTHDELLDVLQGYAAATPDGNDKKILDEWMAANPRYASDLVDFAASRTMLMFSSSMGFQSEEEKQAYLERTRRTRNQFFESRSPVLRSIIKRASELELKKKDLIERLGISPLLLDSLENRTIEFATIPKAFLNRIADALKTQIDSVSAYLQQPPLAAGFHKNNTRPEDIRAENFSKAIQEDLVLTDEQKRELLSLH